MGSWAYCRNCDRKIGPPTIVEAFAGQIECPCGTPKILSHFDQVHAVQQIVDRLDALEKNAQFGCSIRC